MPINRRILSQDAAVVEGLVLHLDAQSYSGTGDWIDLSGNGNDGQINGATFTTNTLSPFESYFDFERDNSENVEVSDSSSLDITPNITLEAWINEESPIENYGRLFWKSGAYALYRGTNGWNFLTGSNVLVHNSGIPSTGNWYHIAVTNDGTNKKLYINGSLLDTEGGSSSIPTNNNSLYIGGIDTDRFFDGKVGMVKVYERDLSASEVTTEYNRNKATYGLS